jgi:signal transduction histidine kinase/ligand-binding sensor domain-containing protein/DNA-binding response OmpR family regulator
MNKKGTIVISIFLAVIGIHSPYAQTPNYRFEHLTTAQGLSGNAIFSIIQDSRDLVWIGTNYGLNCYNGYDVRHFDRSQDPKLLSRKVVTCLYEDVSEMIWIGTLDDGLFIYNPFLDMFKHYTHDPGDSLSLSNNAVNTVYQDTTGIVWVGTYGGLDRYDEETETFTSFMPMPEDRENGKNIITALMEDGEETFWIGSAAGIFFFDRTDKRFLPFDKKPDIPENYQQISCFHQDGEGNIWFGTLKGLFEYTKKKELVPARWSDIEHEDSLMNDAVTSIQEVNDNGNHILWIATRNGLVNYDLIQKRFVRIVIDPSSPYGLSNNSISDLWLNNAGILWIATAWSGVNKLDTRGNPFRHVRLQSGDPDLSYSASSFCMDKNGYLWVGACEGGLFKFDRLYNKLAQYNTNKVSFVDVGTVITNFEDCIYEDFENNLWIGLGGWGPAIFDRKTESFRYLECDLPPGQERPIRISDILEDHCGILWFATYGLYKKEKNESRFAPIHLVDNELLKQSAIYDLYEDKEENIYIGTYEDGLFCLRSQDRDSMHFTRYGTEEYESRGLYRTPIYKIYEDHNGTVWVASGRGLSKFNPQKNQFELIEDTTGLFSEGILEVFGDHQGNLWLSNYTKGLIRYRPETGNIKIFSTSDGLPFDNIVPLYWYQSTDGRIFIGGWMGDGNGFFYFNPDDISDNRHIPNIVITSFNIANKPFSADSSISAKKNLTLKHNQNFFSFQCAALDYANPEKNQYAYYLEGLDEGWIYPGNRRYANYTSVPPGDYIFHVKGSNNDGYWNDRGTAITVTILPPPWKTWWAYTLYGLFMIGLFMAWRRYDLKRQHLKQALEIEHVEAEKLKELDSLKSRFFANISHEFRTPLTLILGPLERVASKTHDAESRQDLSIMQRSALRLQRLINQLLDLSRLEAGKMELNATRENIAGLVRSYVQQFESLARQKRIKLIFTAEQEEIIAFVDRDKIEKILYNLLSNAFKFTGAGGTVAVGVFTPPQSPNKGGEGSHPITPDNIAIPPFRGGTKGGVVIFISDTGKGIPQEQLSRIFDRFYMVDDSYRKDSEGSGIGLALTKELVELHHGVIEVESEVGIGTTFRVFFPVGSWQSAVGSTTSPPLPPLLEERGRRGQRVKGGEVKLATRNLQPVTSKDAPLLLIVEDNADMRRYIRGYLDKTYAILEAEDGEQGLNMAMKHIPDLIISDVMMPKMDGFELCRKIKSDERTSHIPVILLTAKASDDSKIQGLETGADDYLYKPFNHHELIVRVHNLIEQRKKVHEHFINELGLAGKLIPETDKIAYSSLDEQFLVKAKRIVEENMANPDFSIDTFSKLAGMSRSQLHRKTTALFNLSPSEFVRSLRLSRAAQRLKQKSGTVSEIAFDVGFNNLSYFSRSFREQYGVLPSEYSDKGKKN